MSFLCRAKAGIDGRTRLQERNGNECKRGRSKLTQILAFLVEVLVRGWHQAVLAVADCVGRYGALRHTISHKRFFFLPSLGRQSILPRGQKITGSIGPEDGHVDREGTSTHNGSMVLNDCTCVATRLERLVKFLVNSSINCFIHKMVLR